MTRPSKRPILPSITPLTEPKPVTPAEALLAYADACLKQSEEQRFERCVAAHIRNERLKAYRDRLEWCERSGGKA
jgi:hypothetical protein